MPSVFRERVMSFVQRVPKGRVVSYGQVAAACGYPRAARQVGGILKALDPGTRVPWWRVVNRKGELSIKGNWTATKKMQKELLLREGVVFVSEFSVKPSFFAF